MRSLSNSKKHKPSRNSPGTLIEFDRRVRAAIRGEIPSQLPRQSRRSTGQDLELLNKEYSDLKNYYELDLSSTPFIYVFLESAAAKTLGFWIADRIFPASIIGVSSSLMNRSITEIRNAIRHIMIYQFSALVPGNQNLSPRSLQQTESFSRAAKLLEIEQPFDSKFLFPETLFTVASKEQIVCFEISEFS
jgi:hypothetical protein